MSTGRRGLRSDRGVTLLETLVAVVVSGILLGAAMPSLSTALTAHQLKAGIRSTTNYVRVVRSIAVARNAQTRLMVSADGTQLTTQVLSSGTWTTVGSGLTLEGGVLVSSVSPVSGLAFNAQGTTNAASTLTLSSPRGSTGTVSVTILGSVGAS